LATLASDVQTNVQTNVQTRRHTIGLAPGRSRYVTFAAAAGCRLAARLPAVDGQGSMRVTIVGVCGSGKTELARRLASRGVQAHAVAQEHSHVPGLWRHEGTPDLLVYLSASTRVVRRRGKAMSAAELAEQRRRLADARRHAQVRIRTDSLSPDQVERIVLAHVARAGALPRGLDGGRRTAGAARRARRDGRGDRGEWLYSP
jgi:hypothetical protein